MKRGLMVRPLPPLHVGKECDIGRAERTPTPSTTAASRSARPPDATSAASSAQGRKEYFPTPRWCHLEQDIWSAKISNAAYITVSVRWLMPSTGEQCYYNLGVRAFPGAHNHATIAAKLAEILGEYGLTTEGLSETSASDAECQVGPTLVLDAEPDTDSDADESESDGSEAGDGGEFGLSD